MAISHEFFYKLIGVYCRAYSIVLEYNLSNLHRKPSYLIYVFWPGVVDMDHGSSLG